MTIPELAAIVAVLALTLIIGLQLLLAAGLPLGQVAWGGQHRVLPSRLRIGSAAAAVLLAIQAVVILVRAGLFGGQPSGALVGAAMWVFAAMTTLNVLSNLVSKSPLERKLMTPLALLLAVCFWLVTLS